MVKPCPRTIVVTLTLLSCGLFARAAAADVVLELRDTREATRRATIAKRTVAITPGPWSVIGPFDNTGRDKFKLLYPPEREVDLAKSYVGKGGATVAWHEVESEMWGQIDLNAIMGDGEEVQDAIAYAWCEFEAAGAGEVTFDMGSDDGLRFWLDGRMLVDADVYRGFSPDDHSVKVDLAAGRHTILVKVSQGVGGWNFQVRPVADPRFVAELAYHLDRAFPPSPMWAHYQSISVLEPEGIALEVGGLAVGPHGRPYVATRRGDVWVVDGAYDDPPRDAKFTRFAFGLHEPLGAWWKGDGLFVVQRGEMTRLVDSNRDDRADVFETVTSGWGVSGNYHEFAFGPEPDGQGRWWVTLNVGFCGGLGKSIVPWRGWALIVHDDGRLEPVCGGLRSPAGIGRNGDGAMFATDNQGDWVGTNKLMHLEPGTWHGHPAGDRWYETAGMTTPRGEADFKPPAVWFPYDRMGRSASDILVDDTGGAFGPFEGQLFVGDQYAASVMRVALEKVGGEYQGACFPFVDGLDCGVTRLAWGKDGSLFVGMTNRGWWSFGHRQWGLARVVYTGALPLEIHEVRAQPDGFVLTFTAPIDRALLADAAGYAVASFTHHRWAKYGSPEIERVEHRVRSVEAAADGRSVRLRLDRMRPGFVYEIHAPHLRSPAGDPLLHPDAYYTLNAVPTE